MGMADPQDWQDLIRSLADTMYKAVERQQRWHTLSLAVTAEAVNHVFSASAGSLPQVVAEAIDKVLGVEDTKGDS
jgi:hypothetical protein